MVKLLELVADVVRHRLAPTVETTAQHLAVAELMVTLREDFQAMLGRVVKKAPAELMKRISQLFLNVEKLSGYQQALEQAYDLLGIDAKVGVIPYGGETLVQPALNEIK